MGYIDGYVLAVPTANKAAYKAVAETVAAVFKDHGALQIMECWGDEVPEGEQTSFPMAVKCKPDETVMFSWVLWPSKDARDRAHKTSMEDERLTTMGADAMPFDGKRMIMGGFEVLVDA